MPYDEISTLSFRIGLDSYIYDENDSENSTITKITEDYDKYVLASSMLEVCNHILKPNIIAENLFINLLKTIQNILHKDVNINIAILKFYLDMLEIIGYKLNFIVCDNCGLKFMGDIKFNLETGTFRCGSCSGGVKIEPRDFTTMKIIANTDIDRLNTIKINPEFCKSPLKILINNIENRINFKIKSLHLN